MTDTAIDSQTCEQLERIFNQLKRLTEESAKHTERLDNLDKRLDNLEKKKGEEYRMLGERLTNIETRQIYATQVGFGQSPLEPVQYGPAGHALLEPERRWRKTSARRGG